MDRRLRIGTRGSPLALAQAGMVADALRTAHGCTVEIVTVRTSGDRIQDRPLAEVGGKALWTKELDLALLAGETDVSVHSMKDVESERPPALCVAAMLPRADVRDRLLGAPAIESLDEGAKVGTSSPRRMAQLLRLRPDLRVETIRGNVGTRMARLEIGEFDATLLAAAGLDRLGLAGVGAPIGIEEMLPAPSQAAVGIECRADDAEVRALLLAINHAATHACVSAERAFARAVGGTCHSPVAALATLRGEEIRLEAELLSSDGGEQVRGETVFAADDVAASAALGRALLDRAPPAVRMLFSA
ncbi:hydroxymethylbilane synthase [Sphingomonas ginkgonis]|uniref:Porphobilinogen deaminase n=1 Tax=Sphingomonas ginkgonis TaxID=2315330 RepID=A0A429V738_9SPHN|nr:hydroxymethylbilane synthase [Sphingomonas ginkgonis]RST29796.1 hydroxymethylbilane synthase [Sphingomonas ginkgonis]